MHWDPKPDLSRGGAAPQGVVLTITDLQSLVDCLSLSISLSPLPPPPPVINNNLLYRDSSTVTPRGMRRFSR